MALVFAIAVAGVVAALLGETWSTASQRARERQLLWVGRHIRAGIANYYAMTPGGQKHYPPSLEALLLDSRQAGTVRHLRRIYADPMTPGGHWRLIRAPDGGIMGVASTSLKRPIKDDGFLVSERAFCRAKALSDWTFVYDPALMGKVDAERASSAGAPVRCERGGS
jgi:type II secretory pathway pseudopilin PulG